MSHPLAYANQSLYHANILLSGWRAELERGSVPQNQVNQAYASPVQTSCWMATAGCYSPSVAFDNSLKARRAR